MSPERIEHVRVKSRVWAALDRAIRAAGVPCEAFADGVTIEVDDDTGYEPDAVVNCGRPAAADAVAAANPVIVVEVVAPSTEHVDLADNYFRVPTIQHYLIVRARRREVIHHSRSGDAMTIRVINAGRIVLDPPGIAVEPADMYPT